MNRRGGTALSLVAHLLGERDQAGGIEIEDRLGVRLLALLGIVAGEAQDVRNARRTGAQQVALQRDAIAVAHGELQDRVQPQFDHAQGDDEAGDMGLGGRPVGHVDRVGQADQRLQPSELRGEVGRRRRRRLRRHGEMARRQYPLQPPAALALRSLVAHTLLLTFYSLMGHLNAPPGRGERPCTKALGSPAERDHIPFMIPISFRSGRLRAALAAPLIALPVLAALSAQAQAEWVYRTVRVCEPTNRYVQRCKPVRSCKTNYRYESRWCATCRPPRQKTERVPFRVCATQTQCRRVAVRGQSCRNVQRRVWVRNPKIIPDKVPPAKDD